MTVSELKQQLDNLPAEMEVVVYWERNGNSDILDVDEVSRRRGIAKRMKGKKGFEFDSRGPAEYVFISVAEE